MATGWLGWSPAEAWSALIPEILVSIDARIDWARKTNPFGSGDEADVPVSDKLRNAFQELGARDGANS